MPCGNISDMSDSVDQNKTLEVRVYEQIYHIFYHFGLPMICVFGFLGNVLNLAVLNQKRLQTSLMKMEQAASIYLIALASSDLLFCISAFMTTFVPLEMVFEKKGFLLYYTQNCAAVINIFIMTSTWVTVVFAVERYVAICHPLKSRYMLSMKGTRLTIGLIYLFSVLFNIPVFWRYTIQTVECPGNVTYYRLDQQIIFSDTFDQAYRGVWAIFGNLLPLVILVYANVCLVRGIRKSTVLRRQYGGYKDGKHVKESNNKITLTLIIIVILFLTLVAPSELIKQVVLLDSTLQFSHAYMSVEVITNFMQSVNFSINFILYCIINRSFRRTMKHMVLKFVKNYLPFFRFNYEPGEVSIPRGGGSFRSYRSVNLKFPNDSCEGSRV